MGMGKLAMMLCIFLALLLGCGKSVSGVGRDDDGSWGDPPEDPRIALTESFDEKLDGIYKHVEDVEKELAELKSANEQLQNEIDRLDDENWRDVVPDLISANDDVQSATERLERHVSRLSSSFGYQ